MADLIKIDLTLPNPAATERLAAIVAAQARPGDVILLSGDLGAGKTHFARAFINALSDAAEEVPSPTFTLVQSYAATVGGHRLEIAHFDLYRLKNAREMEELGLEDALNDGAVLVEWPERAPEVLPPDALHVRLKQESGMRNARLTGPARWEKLMHD